MAKKRNQLEAAEVAPAAEEGAQAETANPGAGIGTDFAAEVFCGGNSPGLIGTNQSRLMPTLTIQADEAGAVRAVVAALAELGRKDDALVRAFELWGAK